MANRARRAVAGRYGSVSVVEPVRSTRSAGNWTAKGEKERWAVDVGYVDPAEGIEGVVAGASGLGRFRPEFGRWATAQPVSQRAQRGARAVPPRGVNGRFGGCRRGGGFGLPAGGVQVQFASAPVGRRGGGVLPAAVASAALDRLVALVLEPFVQPEHLKQGFGYATDGRPAPVAVVPGLLGVRVDMDQAGAAQIATGSLGPAPAEAGFLGEKRQR